MDFTGGKMMETSEDPPYPMMSIVKEERVDFEEEEKKGETSRRGRTRSLTKKSADKADIKAKLERSRQSARECRARKKLRYQYLEEIISETEKSINQLRRELEHLKIFAKEMDEGVISSNLMQYRQLCVERKVAEPMKHLPSLSTDIHMEDPHQQSGQEVLRHVQATSTSPASSGIASASTSAGTGITTMAFSPTGSQLSAFAAMMLNPSTLTHTISPS